jgi:hypothetical protein
MMNAEDHVAELLARREAEARRQEEEQALRRIEEATREANRLVESSIAQLDATVEHYADLVGELQRTRQSRRP